MPTLKLRSQSLAPLGAATFALFLSACDNIKIRREPIPNPNRTQKSQAPNGTQGSDPANHQELSASAKQRTQALCEKSCKEEGMRLCEGVRFIQNQDNCVEHCMPSMEDTFAGFQGETCTDALISLFECTFAQPCVEASKLLSLMGGQEEFSFGDLGPCTIQLASAMQACQPPEPDPTQDPDAPLAEFYDQIWHKMYGLAIPASNSEVRIMLSEEPIDNCDTPEYVRSEFIYFQVDAKQATTTQSLVTFRTDDHDIEVLGTVVLKDLRADKIRISVDAGVPGIAHVRNELIVKRCN